MPNGVFGTLSPDGTVWARSNADHQTRDAATDRQPSTAFEAARVFSHHAGRLTHRVLEGRDGACGLCLLASNVLGKGGDGGKGKLRCRTELCPLR